MDPSEGVVRDACAEEGGQDPPGEQNSQEVPDIRLYIDPPQEDGSPSRAQGTARRHQKPQSDPELIGLPTRHVGVQMQVFGPFVPVIQGRKDFDPFPKIEAPSAIRASGHGDEQAQCAELPGRMRISKNHFDSQR